MHPSIHLVSSTRRETISKAVFWTLVEVISTLGRLPCSLWSHSPGQFSLSVGKSWPYQTVRNVTQCSLYHWPCSTHHTFCQWSWFLGIQKENFSPEAALILFFNGKFMPLNSLGISLKINFTFPVNKVQDWSSQVNAVLEDQAYYTLFKSYTKIWEESGILWPKLTLGLMDLIQSGALFHHLSRVPWLFVFAGDLDITQL